VIKGQREEASLLIFQGAKIMKQNCMKGKLEYTEIYIENGKAAIKATELLSQISLVEITQFLPELLLERSQDVIIVERVFA
jgi:hypothetical protein